MAGGWESSPGTWARSFEAGTRELEAQRRARDAERLEAIHKASLSAPVQAKPEKTYGLLDFLGDIAERKERDRKRQAEKKAKELAKLKAQQNAVQQKISKIENPTSISADEGSAGTVIAWLVGIILTVAFWDAASAGAILIGFVAAGFTKLIIDNIATILAVCFWGFVIVAGIGYLGN